MFNLDWASDYGTAERSTEPELDLLVIESTYAGLLQSIARSQYSPSAQTRLSSGSALKHGAKLSLSRQRLESWRSNIELSQFLRKHSDNDSPADRGSTMTSRRRDFRVFCHYHRALFLIYYPSIALIDGSQITDKAELEGLSELKIHCMEQCIESVCAVIETASAFAARNTIVVDR